MHLTEVYTSYNANIHRGVHFLSDMSSEAYENAREKVRSFINAGKKEEIIFTSGTTGSINGIAFSFGERYIKPGDEIIISHLEHHANIVPWQMMCERKGAVLKVIPINDNGEIILEEYLKLLSPKTKTCICNTGIKCTWNNSSCERDNCCCTFNECSCSY